MHHHPLSTLSVLCCPARERFRKNSSSCIQDIVSFNGLWPNYEGKTMRYCNCNRWQKEWRVGVRWKNKRKKSASELFGVRRAIKRIVHRVNYIFKRIRDMCTTWYFSKVQFIFIFCDFSVCKTRFVFLCFLICVDSGWLHLYYLSHMIVFALVFCVLRSFCNSVFLYFCICFDAVLCQGLLQCIYIACPVWLPSVYIRTF